MSSIDYQIVYSLYIQTPARTPNVSMCTPRYDDNDNDDGANDDDDGRRLSSSSWTSVPLIAITILIHSWMPAFH